jgi:hypothetical protein
MNLGHLNQDLKNAAYQSTYREDRDHRFIRVRSQANYEKRRPDECDVEESRGKCRDPEDAAAIEGAGSQGSKCDEKDVGKEYPGEPYGQREGLG